VNEKLWIVRISSKIGIILQQLNNKGMFNQLFMVETSEEATIVEDANTHTESMEIQIESKGGKDIKSYFEEKEKRVVGHSYAFVTCR